MISQSVTLTSKGQVTIPARIIKEVGLKKGERIIFYMEDGRIYMEKATDMVKRLAGSLPVPPRFKGMDIEKVIKIAKEEYFADKFKNGLY